MEWTKVVLPLLPATVKQINANPLVQEMNKQHRAERVARGKWEKPINGMVYDTLYRLRRRGIVVRDDNGVYKLA